MNNQNQIKEMTRDYRLCYPCEMFAGYVDDDGNLCGKKHCLEGLDCTECGVPTDLAKVLIKENYRKIPEGAVVLTQEEYEVLKIKAKEKHWLETCMSVWKSAKIDARKETAREFFDLSEQCGGGVVFYQRARALAQRCGVEVKE